MWQTILTGLSAIAAGTIVALVILYATGSLDA